MSALQRVLQVALAGATRWEKQFPDIFYEPRAGGRGQALLCPSGRQALKANWGCLALGPLSPGLLSSCRCRPGGGRGSGCLPGLLAQPGHSGAQRFLLFPLQLPPADRGMHLQAGLGRAVLQRDLPPRLSRSQLPGAMLVSERGDV